LLGAKGTAVETSVQVGDCVTVLRPAGKFGAAHVHESPAPEPDERKLGPQAQDVWPAEEVEPAMHGWQERLRPAFTA
jgi:hypothetical protein